MLKSRKLEFKWAIIFVIMMLAWMIGEKTLGFHDEKIAWHVIVTNFVAIPAILIYVIALYQKKKKEYNGEMTYWQSFKSGFFITLIITVLSPFTQLLTSLVITPDYFKNMIQFVTENGIMTKEAAEANFNLESYIIQSVIGAFVMGMVTTAVISVFVSRKRKK